MIVCHIDKPKESMKKKKNTLQNLQRKQNKTNLRTNKFSKASDYKMNTCKILYTNKEDVDVEIKATILFTTAPQKMKCMSKYKSNKACIGLYAKHDKT